MTEEDYSWINEGLDKIVNDKEITKKEIDTFLTQTQLSKTLAQLLNADKISYIELIGNDELINKLPENPLDEGGKEYLKRSILIANKLNENKKLNDDEKGHLVKEWMLPLKYIYSGRDKSNFKEAKKMVIENTRAADAKEEKDESTAIELMEHTFFIKMRSTKTFLNELEKALINLSTKEIETDEAIALDFKGYPKESLFHTTLLSRDLPLIMQEDEDQQLNLFHIDVPVRRRDPDKRIKGKITIDDIIEKHNNITFFDMFHYLGICRLYNNGDTNFTPDMVVRAAYSDSKKRVTDKQRNKAIESIDKFMRTVIDIDLTHEYELYKKAKGNRVVLSENMIYAKAVKLKHSNGIISAGYRLLEQPVLDVHAFNLSQIDYLDSDIVEISGGEADALLYTYLNSRLATAKNSKNKMKNIILLETIYKYMDLENPNRKKRAQVKSKIESRLNEWENKKVIKGSKFHKDKGKFRSVEIIV